MDVALRASLIFKVFRELNKHLILLKLDRVTIAAQLRCLCQELLLFPLVSVEVTAQLSNQLTVFLVICLGLQGLILDQELAAFFSCLFLHFRDLLLKLMSLGVQLHFDDIELPLGFVVLLAQAVHFVLLRIEFNTMPAFDVFLDLHPHDICVDRQRHLVGH